MDVDNENRESTQIEPQQSIPPVQPEHIGPTQPSPQRGTILAKAGIYVLIDWDTRIEVRSASQINEGNFDTPVTGIATTFAPADDYDLLKQLKKRDQSNFSAICCEIRGRAEEAQVWQVQHEQVVLLYEAGSALAEGQFISSSQSSSHSVPASKAQQSQLTTV
ncbi:hypothetical protein SLS60_011555 [Paraconiothyrium brasiliense]|uniref:Uncharacterized protein n=1 Tax=Paraconiothyrium brasiliense TaxID=300254 RepID=A0ABR3QJ24_9PLEO